MSRDRNDGSDYEAHYFPDPVKLRDPDRDREDIIQAEIDLENMQFSDAGMKRLFDALNPSKFPETFKKANSR